MEKKIYRKKDDGSWENVTMLIFPDGQEMNEKKHDFERDGYFWSEEPPKEFIEWKEQQNNDLI